MTTQDKKIKVVNTTDFNNNEIENAKIDVNKNEIINLPESGKVDDVLVNGQSVVENKIASVQVPTKLSELENDGEYINNNDIKSLRISTLGNVANTVQKDNFNLVNNNAIAEKIDESKITAVDSFIYVDNLGTLPNPETLGQKVLNTFNNKIYTVVNAKEIYSDYIVTGNLNIDANGIIRGFTQSNYLTFSSNWWHYLYPLKIQMCLHTLSLTQAEGPIFIIYRSDDNSPLFDVKFTMNGGGNNVLTFTTYKRDGTVIETYYTTFISWKGEGLYTSQNYILEMKDSPNFEGTNVSLTLDGAVKFNQNFKSLTPSTNIDDDFYYNMGGYIKLTSIYDGQYGYDAYSIISVVGTNSYISKGSFSPTSSIYMAHSTLNLAWDSGQDIQSDKLIFNIDTESTYRYDGTNLNKITTLDYNDLNNKPTIGDASLILQKNSTDIGIFTANATNSTTINIEVPTKTSDLTNDSDFVSDASYVHTDNNYTTEEKTKLAGIETGAQVNTVTGVKGDSEESYRTGNINITKANIGLGNVDNTSDLDKPISTATQAALNTKQNIINNSYDIYTWEDTNTLDYSGKAFRIFTYIFDAPVWEARQEYFEHQIIKYSTHLYQCTENYISSDNFSDDLASGKWEIYNKVFIYPKSQKTLIFYNGKLLDIDRDYQLINGHIELNDSRPLIVGDIFTAISGAGPYLKFTIDFDHQQDIYTEGSQLSETISIFKNGYKLRPQIDYTIINHNQSIHFSDDIADNIYSNDLITVIDTKTNTLPDNELIIRTYETETHETKSVLYFPGPRFNFIFKNGLLLNEDIDYTSQYGDWEDDSFEGEDKGVRVELTEPLTDSDTISVLYNDEFSIYDVINDKQNPITANYDDLIFRNNRMTFKGDSYCVLNFNNLTGNRIKVYCTVSDNSLVFKNGQLLRNGEEYDFEANLPVYVPNNIGDPVDTETSYIYFKQNLQQDDNIIVINGLNPRTYIASGSSLNVGYPIQSNSIVLKNGVLLSGQGSWDISEEDRNVMTFNPPLNDNDVLTIIPNYNTRIMFTDVSSSDLQDGNKLNIGRISDTKKTLVWLNNILLSNNQDYVIDNASTLVFNVEIEDHSFIQVSAPNERTLYNLIGDKQDRLPNLEAYKILSNDGNSLKWIKQFDDGVYHPKNDDELKEIINSDIWGGTIDFSAFDFSTFDPNGYVINNKSFNIRNFTFSSEWSNSEFRWFKTPMFTLNNASLFCFNLVIDANNIHLDPNDAANSEPLIKVNNGNFTVQIGSINIDNVSNINKIAVIELNNSQIQMTEYSVNLVDFNSVLTGICIEVNGTGDIILAKSLLEFTGVDLINTYHIKYNDNIDTGCIVTSSVSDFFCPQDDSKANIIIPNNNVKLDLFYTDIGNVNVIEPNESVNLDVHGIFFALKDLSNKINYLDVEGGTFNLKGLNLHSEDWNFPISDVHLQSDNAQDAIKELAARGGGGGSISQTDYWQHAGVIQDTITGITGDITVNESTYFSQVTLDRCVNYFKYDGSDWYLGDPDEGETPTLVDLTDYGIDVSQATFDTDSSFEVYSEYLNGKTSFTVSQLVDIHSVFLNGILQLKKDYEVNNHTITFNDYTLKSSDSISII